MKFMLMFIAANTCTIACVAIAGWLASHNTSGWGWFLFAGVVLSHTMDTGKESAHAK